MESFTVCVFKSICSKILTITVRWGSKWFDTHQQSFMFDISLFEVKLTKNFNRIIRMSLLKCGFNFSGFSYSSA